MRTYVALEKPHLWVSVDRKGRVTDSGVASALISDELPADKGLVVGVIPGAEVVVKRVSVPAKSRKKAIAAIPFALEDSLTADVDDLHFSLLEWSAGEEATVAIVGRDRMRQWVDACNDGGFELDGIVPEFDLVPTHPQARLTIVRGSDGVVRINSDDGTGKTLDGSLFDLWWQEVEDKSMSVAVNDRRLAEMLIRMGGTSVAEWDIGNNYAEWLSHRGSALDMERNLLQGEYEPEHRNNASWPMKAAAIVFGLALAIKLGSDGAEYLWLNQRDSQLDQQLQSTWVEMFPDSPGAVDPFSVESRVQAELERLQTGNVSTGDFQQLLAAVSRSVPQTQAQVEEVTFRDNTLIVTCSSADFAGLDVLQQQFDADEDVVAELESSGARDDRVSGRFRISRRGA